MNDDVWARLRDRAPQSREIPHVTYGVTDVLLEAGGEEEVTLVIGRKRVTVNLGSEMMQHERHPGALEAGVASQKDFLSTPEPGIDHQALRASAGPFLFQELAFAHRIHGVPESPMVVGAKLTR